MSDLKNLFDLIFGHPPGQLIIQATDACNANCPQCELRVSADYKRTRISMDHVKRMIDTAAERGVKALSFTGGEPFLLGSDLLDMIDHAGKAGIKYTRTGTNGFFLCGVEHLGWEKRVRRLIERLAATPLRALWISLDSADLDLHEKMRGLPGVAKGIERALPIFHEHGIYPAVNLGMNRNIGGASTAQLPSDLAERRPEAFYGWFHSAFRHFYRTVVQMGFTTANACYPMSVQGCPERGLSAVYGASSASPLVRFTDAEKKLLFRSLRDAAGSFRDRLRIFTPATSLYLLEKAYSDPKSNLGYPCRGGTDFFFVAAQTAHTFPCGFRGEENLGFYDSEEFSPSDKSPQCRACDWECYRDPSNLLGPLLEFRRAPLKLLTRFYKDPEHRRLWLKDLGYCLACDFFSGRKPPNYGKLARFAPKIHRRVASCSEAEEDTPYHMENRVAY